MWPIRIICSYGSEILNEEFALLCRPYNGVRGAWEVEACAV